MKTIKSYLLAAFCLSLCFVGCDEKPKSKQAAPDTKAKPAAATPDFVHYFATDTDCLYQKNIEISPRKKLILFDPQGVFPDNLYATSPSAAMKNELTTTEAFKDWSREKFDFFVMTMHCNVGQKLTAAYKIKSYPTVILIDENKRVLYKKEELIGGQDLLRDLNMIIK